MTMHMKTKPENDTELHDKINRETGRVAWSELQRHFHTLDG
jgi:hypothetical protein